MTLRAFLAAMGVAAAVSAVDVATAPLAVAGPPYKNCSEAHADGRYDIPKDDPGYSPKLDRDHDGIACESYK